MEVALAVLAVTHSRTGPAIREDTIHLVQGHNFLGYPSHEVEVIRPERARNPKLGIGRVPPFIPGGIHRDPIRMRIIDILMRRVWIGAGHHIHPHRPASFD
jgi:hypothetical protein